MTMKPITDMAEVAIDFPEKTFIGTFSQSSAYEVTAGREGVTLKLVRTAGQRRTIEISLHYHLLAEMLEEAARELGDKHLPDEVNRRVLLRAVETLRTAVAEPASS
jgi:hypothetical protein